MHSLWQRLFAFLLLSGLVRGADITASGDWTEIINATHLTSGAGSDLPAQFESVSGVTSLSLSNAAGAWSVRARIGGGGGHSNVTVWVKRTSAGSGSGSIADGTAWMPLTGSDAVFFSGTDDRAGISIQYKLTGLTHDVSPATYFSSITFTVQ